ncbi:GPCR fungal pheromone mating factor, partial [Lineolata rhizophorae]
TPTPIIPLDPYAQDITIFLPDGTPIPLTLADVDYWASYGIRICINYASQIGASLVLLAVLLVLTLPQPHKRTSPVFALNALALATNGVRSILQCLYFTGPWYVAYAFFGFDYSGVPARDVGISCAASVLTLVTLGFIEASLVLQVHVVHVTARGLTKYGLLLMTALVAVMAIGFRFALTVLNCEAIVAKAPFDEWRWLAHANNITTTISIFVFSAIFVAKLALAMGDRKRLGMKQYGAMRVIFIMGCQTMVVPAIFSALQYFTDAPELGSQVITIVALFLPLSAIWAHSTMSAATGSSS